MRVWARFASAPALALVLALGACSSESDRIDLDLDGSGENSVAGIYAVTLSSTTDDQRDEEWIFLLAPPRPDSDTDTARIAGYDRDDPQRVMIGQYNQGTGQTLTGALRFYDVVLEEVEQEPEEPVDPDDPEAEEPVLVEIPVRRVRSLTISGVFDPRNTLDATFTGQSSDGDSVGDGQIFGEYQERAYERISSVEAMTGSWVRQDEFGFTVVGFTIEPGTGLFGTAPDPVSETDCRYDGRFALIDSRINIYEISMTQSQCGRTDEPGDTPPEREMLGLATLRDIAPGETALEAGELLMIMGSRPLDDGSAEARVFRLKDESGL